MEKTPEYKWYVIYTKPRNEKKVAAELLAKGIEHYCPLIKTMRQWSDRKKVIEVPLFNSYLFVFVSEKEFFEVLTVKGVVKYITFERKAVAIPEYQIEAIKQTLLNEIKFEVSTENFKIGQKIEIINGVLSGVLGEIVTISGKKQLLLRIENIGYSLLININQSDTKIRN
jgi:transcription antitermination factor NusG